MDWRGYSGSRGTNLMASAGILRDGVAGQITVTEMGMWVDSTMTARSWQLSMGKEGKMPE